jgi:cell division protein FtsQ
MQKVVPRAGRPKTDAPDEAEQDGDESVRVPWGRSGDDREETSRGSWWHPQSSWGRGLLALGVLTVLGSLTAGGLLLRAFLERDSGFRIAGTANIQAAGMSEVNRADLLPVFGEDIGKNIFFVHLDQRRHDLEAIPWVEHATVMRVLPNQLRISVVERHPVAFTQIGQQTGLVDADGVLLTMPAASMARHNYSFPVVSGLDPNDSAASRKTRMSVYMRLIAELDAGGQHNSEQISEVDLSNPEDARVKMTEQGADITAHFGDERFMERFERYKSHIGEWRQQYPRLAGVDLRYDNQVVLKMNSAGSDTQPATLATSNAQPVAPVSHANITSVDGKVTEAGAEKTPPGKTDASKLIAKNNPTAKGTRAVKSATVVSSAVVKNAAAKGKNATKSESTKSGAAKSATAKSRNAKNKSDLKAQTHAASGQRTSTATRPVDKGKAGGKTGTPSAVASQVTLRKPVGDRTQKARVEKLRLEQQHKRAEAHRTALSTDKHKNVPMAPLAPAEAVSIQIEGQ